MPNTLSGFAPTISLAENTVNAAPRLLDSDVTFVATGPLGGGRLIMRGLLAEDRVSILAVGDGPGQIGFDGTTVRYGGVAIGTASGGVGAEFIVRFTDAATSAAVDALIERLSYANTSDTPTATRALTLNVVDAAGSALVPTTFTALTGAANPFAGIDVGAASKPTFGDVDGDGLADLTLGSDGRLQAWRNTGDDFVPLTGASDPFRTFPFSDTGGIYAPAYDGRLAYFVGDTNGLVTRWSLNTAVNEWGPTPVAATTGAYATPTLVDLDGNGTRELVAGSTGGSTGGIQLLGGSTNPFAGVTTGLLPAPAFVDLDDDGRLDLVVGAVRFDPGTGEAIGTLQAWRNTGSGYVPLTGAANPFNGFQVGNAILDELQGGAAPSFFDLNGDGLLDLVSGTAEGTLLAWRNTTARPAITVTVAAQNDAPVFQSGGIVFTAENRPAGEIVHRALVRDAEGDAIAFSLSGADAALFTIDAAGAVRFKAAPDFEVPADSDGDNRYKIVIEADDGTATTTKDLTVIVTDRPESRLTDLATSVTFGENAVNAAPRLLDAQVAFSAEDNLAGGRLVVSGLLAEDRLSVLAEGDGPGQIGLDGATLRFGGVAFGTLSGGVGGDLVVDFGAAVTPGAVDALIQRLAYANTSDTPAATRTLTIEVEDAAGRGLTGPALGRYVPLVDDAYPWTTVPIGSLGGRAVPVVTDLDSDGLPDLVVARPGALQAWHNTGSGFTPLTGADDPFAGVTLRGGGIQVPGFSDLDADGDLDLVLSQLDQSRPPDVYENIGGGYRFLFGQEDGGRSDNPFRDVTGRQYVGGGLVALPPVNGITFFDVNGDRRDDVILDIGSPRVFLNTPDGFVDTWGQSTPPGGPAPDDRPLANVLGRASTFADLNGDGLADLVTARIPPVVGVNDQGIIVRDTSRISLTAWRNTGDGFVEMTGADDPFRDLPGLPPLNAVDQYTNLFPAFADLDNDGRLDLVLGDRYGNLRSYRNLPPATTITVGVTAENEAPTGAVLLAEEGGLLRATDTLADADGLGTIVYGWEGSADGGATWQAIPGATGATLAPDAAVAGLLVRPFAAYTDGRGTAELVASAEAARIGTAGRDDLRTGPGVPILYGLDGDDSLLGGAGGNALVGGAGNDTLAGGLGNDTIDGGAGSDTATLSGTQASYRFGIRDGVVITSGADGLDQFVNVEGFQWGNAVAVSIASLQAAPANAGLVYAKLGSAAAGYVLPEAYSGPVAGLANQQLGGTGNDIMLGTGLADFLNGLAGDDAIDGGAGNDVIDGGLGSNFLTGGAGRDVFFVDGRGAATANTWSTLTDYTAGEQVTIWGYRPGVSNFVWVASDGVTGYRGATMHWDLDGNGLIDTSVTFSGLTQAQLPVPTFGVVGGQDYILFG